MPINAVTLPSPPGTGMPVQQDQPAASGSGGGSEAAALQAELEKLKLQNRKGASAYENLRAKAMEYKEEVEKLRKQLAEMEKKGQQPPSSKSNPGAFADFDFGFAATPPPVNQGRPSTPAFSFDASGSLI